MFARLIVSMSYFIHGMAYRYAAKEVPVKAAADIKAFVLLSIIDSYESKSRTKWFFFSERVFMLWQNDVDYKYDVDYKFPSPINT